MLALILIMVSIVTFLVLFLPIAAVETFFAAAFKTAFSATVKTFVAASVLWLLAV